MPTAKVFTISCLSAAWLVLGAASIELLPPVAQSHASLVNGNGYRYGYGIAHAPYSISVGESYPHGYGGFGAYAPAYGYGHGTLPIYYPGAYPPYRRPIVPLQPGYYVAGYYNYYPQVYNQPYYGYYP